MKVELTLENNRLTIRGCRDDLETAAASVLLHFLERAEKNTGGYSISIDEHTEAAPPLQDHITKVRCPNCGRVQDRFDGVGHIDWGYICPNCGQDVLRLYSEKPSDVKAPKKHEKHAEEPEPVRVKCDACGHTRAGYVDDMCPSCFAGTFAPATNAGVACDTANGPCACGAWHEEGSLILHQGQLLACDKCGTTSDCYLAETFCPACFQGRLRPAKGPSGRKGPSCGTEAAPPPAPKDVCPNCGYNKTVIPAGICTACHKPFPEGMLGGGVCPSCGNCDGQANAIKTSKTVRKGPQPPNPHLKGGPGPMDQESDHF